VAPAQELQLQEFALLVILKASLKRVDVMSAFTPITHDVVLHYRGCESAAAEGCWLARTTGHDTYTDSHGAY
jgi:hypothetical protein